MTIKRRAKEFGEEDTYEHGDLTRIDDCIKAEKDIDYGFHWAASGGSLIYYNNTMMNTNMLGFAA